MMERFHLANEWVEAEIGAWGAELLSLRGPDGKEQMWDGAPDIWGRSGPVIFPILGGWPKGHYIYHGKRYQMDKNGFARSCVFEAARAERDKVELLLWPNEKTKSQYPFSFRLKVRYSLDGLSLRVRQSVVNTEKRMMPAGLGLHPGFRWERSRSGAFLRFSCAQTILAFHSDGKRYPLLENEDKILLSDQFFAEGAVSLENMRSAWVEFSRPGAAWDLRLHHSGYPYLTLWSAGHRDAEFLCIEPSTGVGTDGDSLLDRRGIIILAPGEVLTRELRIEFVQRRE